MADQDPQQPSLWDRMNQSLGDLWAKDKAFLFLFGVIILIVKFRSILIDILVKSGKEEADKAKQENDKLLQQENQASTEADKLVEQAKNEPSKQQPVTDDWYKKKDGN